MAVVIEKKEKSFGLCSEQTEEQQGDKEKCSIKQGQQKMAMVSVRKTNILRSNLIKCFASTILFFLSNTYSKKALLVNREIHIGEEKDKRV